MWILFHQHSVWSIMSFTGTLCLHRQTSMPHTCVLHNYFKLYLNYFIIISNCIFLMFRWCATFFLRKVAFYKCRVPHYQLHHMQSFSLSLWTFWILQTQRQCILWTVHLIVTCSSDANIFNAVLSFFQFNFAGMS